MFISTLLVTNKASRSRFSPQDVFARTGHTSKCSLCYR